MTSHFTGFAACAAAGGKLMYSHRRHAKAAARRTDPSERMSTWRCAACGNWHIGHRRGPLLDEVIAQVILGASDGVVQWERLRVVAEDTIGTDRVSRRGRPLATHLLTVALARARAAGAVSFGAGTVTLVDPVKLAAVVDEALAEWTSRDSGVA